LIRGAELSPAGISKIRSKITSRESSTVTVCCGGGRTGEDDSWDVGVWSTLIVVSEAEDEVSRDVSRKSEK
jgi:hypothetical protein